MLYELLQAAPRRQSSRFMAIFRHLGAVGLFFLAILDSSPLPTFGGPDILIVILVSTRISPWYVYVVVATVGSAVGAYITFQLAHRAGRAYLDSKFGQRRIPALLNAFDRWGLGALVASTAIPFPVPTSLFFAAAGASNRYRLRSFMTTVTFCRAIRYTAVALIAHVYGRHIIRVLRHPGQYWGWLLVFAAIFAFILAAGFLFTRRLTPPSAALPDPGR